MSEQTKVKSLSLSRKTQTPPRKEESARMIIAEDDKADLSNLEATLNSPIARPSRLCSTPNQKSVQLAEESPEQYYRSSPTLLYPCTQDSSEIVWDWQSTGNKTSDSNGIDKFNQNNIGEVNHTPKRPQRLFQKKRTAKAYSPLLNLSNKRKFVNLEVAESIGKFAEELKALADKIITEQNGETSEKKNSGNIAEEISVGSSKELGIFEMKTQKYSDIHEATTLKNYNKSEEKNDPEKHTSSLGDLFDDSDDACMVQCSQEIENNLKINADEKSVQNLSNKGKGGVRKTKCRTSSSSSNTNMGLKSYIVNIENKFQGETSFSNFKLKEKSNIKISPSRSRLKLENDIPASQIPDDSFDDCLALCLDDDDDLLSKFVENKKREDTTKTFNRRGDCIPTNVSGQISNPDNQTLDSSSYFEDKPRYIGSENATSTLQSRKFFKTKSLSDSYCGNTILGKNGKPSTKSNSNSGRSHQPPISKSNSNHNLSTKTTVCVTPGKVPSTPNLNHCIPAAGSRSTSKQAANNTVSYSYLRSNNDVSSTNKGNSDHYSDSRGVYEKPCKAQKTAVSLSPQYNAEEIERKRLEAKMRLEANKLKQMNSNKSNNVGLGVQNKRPLMKR